MLDTIVYIPTILAYAFIGLLAVILCFIVVYISHKVYESIYDYLPMPRSIISTLLETQEEIAPPKHRKSAMVYLKTSGSFNPKYKSALRFIVSLETCYLAYVVFETGKRIPQHDMLLATASFSDFRKHTHLVKYYDRLTMIPMGRMMEKCDYPELLARANSKISHFPEEMETAAQTNKPTLAPEVTKNAPPSNSNSLKYAADAESHSVQGTGPDRTGTSTTAGRPTATFATALNALAQTGTRPSRPPSSP